MRQNDSCNSEIKLEVKLKLLKKNEKDYLNNDSSRSHER